MVSCVWMSVSSGLGDAHLSQLVGADSEGHQLHDKGEEQAGEADAERVGV